MDIKRTILIVALAIVSYVMVLKWNQDYGQAALPTQNVASSTLPRPCRIPSRPEPPAPATMSASAKLKPAPAETPVALSKD
jgi:YidC/Oxa1 family membrane protein insertase